MKPRNTGVGAARGAAATKLTNTDVPGVYRNSQGILVDEHGVKVSFKQVKAADNAHLAESTEDADHVPALLLRAWSNDPTLPRAVRMDAAKAAAPYFSPRLATVTAAVQVSPTQVDFASMTPDQLQAAMEAIDKLLNINATVKGSLDG